MLHTHGAYDPIYETNNDNFSPTDRRTARDAGMPMYLAAPVGTLFKYNPTTKETIEISNNIPYDPNHPERYFDMEK